MMLFERLIQPGVGDTILDVGGNPETWLEFNGVVHSIECVNILESIRKEIPRQKIITSVGDGCALPYEDLAYDIVFSNSVIEHVGDWDRQTAFACEARRVASRLWVQCPSIFCPIEPHYLFPFVHWLPVEIRRRVLRWCTPWGILTRPTQEQVDATIKSTQLLTKKQMQTLFPDCRILTERFLGIFPKSYIAFRTCSDGM